MKKLIDNPNTLMSGDGIIDTITVRSVQAKRGDFLRCLQLATIQPEDFGTFTKGKDYEVVNGLNDDPEYGTPSGYDNADVIDDAGLLIRVNIDPDHPAIKFVGLFGILKEE